MNLSSTILQQYYSIPFSFNGYIASGIWQEIATLVEDCDYPMARYGSACTTNGPIMYIHGGHVQYGTNKWGFTSELISFNMETRTWRIESPHFSKHPPPTQLEAVVGKPQNYLFLHRDFHTAVTIKDKIIVFGGRSKFKYYSFINAKV